MIWILLTVKVALVLLGNCLKPGLCKKQPFFLFHMEVLCINADKLPPGAEVQEGKTYSVESEFINNFDQRVYMLRGIANEGRTKFGLPWIGYRADRFLEVDGTLAEKSTIAYSMN